MRDVDKIEFVTDGRVYVAPPHATRTPFVVVLGNLLDQSINRTD